MRLRPWVELTDRERGWRAAWVMMSPLVLAALVLLGLLALSTVAP